MFWKNIFYSFETRLPLYILKHDIFVKLQKLYCLILTSSAVPNFFTCCDTLYFVETDCDVSLSIWLVRLEKQGWENKNETSSKMAADTTEINFGIVVFTIENSRMKKCKWLVRRTLWCFSAHMLNDSGVFLKFESVVIWKMQLFYFYYSLDRSKLGSIKLILKTTSDWKNYCSACFCISRSSTIVNKKLIYASLNLKWWPFSY